jgi:hypothetical protein
VRSTFFGTGAPTELPWIQALRDDEEKTPFCQPALTEAGNSREGVSPARNSIFCKSFQTKELGSEREEIGPDFARYVPPSSVDGSRAEAHAQPSGGRCEPAEVLSYRQGSQPIGVTLMPDDVRNRELSRLSFRLCRKDDFRLL